MQPDVEGEVTLIYHTANLIAPNIIRYLNLTQQIMFTDQHGHSGTTVIRAEVLGHAYLINLIVT